MNVLTGSINLGYVNDNCATTLCTLETYSSYFTPLFKNAIDGWFTNNGISSNVVITFTGNTMAITNLPNGFIPYSIGYGPVSPYAQAFFGFGEVNGSIGLSSDGILVKPSFFNLSSFTDGIYSFEVKVSEAGGHVTESNCAFVDIETKCRVASVLQNIKKETEGSQFEKSSSMIHLLHYALVNGSNCGCNCAELCAVYRELFVMLGDFILLNSNSSLINNCGC